MAQDQKRRQAKLAKKKAKRNEVHRQLVKRKNEGLEIRMQRAATHPILDSLVAKDLDSKQMGQVLLSRKLPDGSIAFATFLVDTACLGVKDCFGRIASPGEYREFLEQVDEQMRLERTTAPYVRKLVEQAVEYAGSWGLPPHADYAKLTPIFGDVDSSECQDEFEFGKNGKPYYVQGPYDSRDRIRNILATLHEVGGPGSYHYVLSGDETDIPEFIADLANFG
ncbi:MAG: hypothetical protein R3C99_09640 [Pirellulaceae bacterium]